MRSDFDVFVSYARSDEAAAEELNGWLCAEGFSSLLKKVFRVVREQH